MMQRSAIPVLVGGLALGLLSGAEAAKPALVSPSEAVVAGLLAKATPGHPRLCADPTTFPRVVTQAKQDPRLAGLIAAVLAQADATLAAKPVERILEGRRLLGVSRTALLRLTALGAAWRLTGEARYAQRGERELLAICAFSDWHPEHFLDVGEMTLAVAIGYDWLFQALPAATRAAVHQAIVSKGIAPSYGAKPEWWISGDNNWCQVCHAGLMAGALAISEEEPALAARVVQRAVANLPKVMAASFAPDGAYPEGPGYWEYGTTFNLIAIDLLRTRLGQDFGLSGLPGFRATADYIAHVYGPTGLAFNYSDCGELKARCSPAQIWFARELHRDWQLPAGQDPATDKAFAKERLLALALTWADPAGGAKPVERPLDYAGAGHKPVAMFRSAWNDANACYLAVTAGTPSSNHGHMDVGSFVFEAKGVRWAIDLGMQDYNSLESKGVDLWNKTQGSQRWSVFRLNQACHNVLVLAGQPQQVAGFAAIADIISDGPKPGCTIDLTPVYAGQATRVERRFSLPQRASLVIDDSITGLVKAGTVRWQLATRAAATIAANGRHARLTQDGKTLDLTVAAPERARLVVADAVGSQPFDVANPGVRILAAEFAAEAGATVTFRVTLDP